MKSAPNFSSIASTNGLDHGSCCGPFGLGGAAGAAGFAPGGGGGGFGTAAFGSAGAAGFGGSAGCSGCWPSFGSSAIYPLPRTNAQQEILAQRSTALPQVTVVFS